MANTPEHMRRQDYLDLAASAARANVAPQGLSGGQLAVMGVLIGMTLAVALIAGGLIR